MKELAKTWRFEVDTFKISANFFENCGYMS
jgi:hypothetical protein